MKKQLIRYWLCVFLVLNWQARAQCPPAVEILNRITSIQNNKISGYPEKIKQLQQLQQLYLKCHRAKDSIYARMVHRLGDFFSKTGNYEEAIRLTKEAVAVNRGFNKDAEPSFLTNSYFNLGTFYKNLYLYDESQLFFDSCILVGRHYQDKHFIVNMAYEQKAYAFFQIGDYQKSIETADNGILWVQTIKDNLAQAPLLSQKAQSQVELHMLHEAEQNIEKVIFILENEYNNTDALAIAYSIYANLLNKKNETKPAIRFYQKSFGLNKENGNWVQCSRDMLDLGYLYDHSLHNEAAAITCYQQGINIAKNINDVYLLAGLYINIGIVNWRQQNYRQALHYYQKGLNILPIQFNDTSIKSNPTENMLKLVANDYFVSTLLANKGEALLNLYSIEKKRELLQIALHTFLMADKNVDMMRWKQYGEQSKLFWREKTKQMYENAIETCYLLNNIEKAYYFFEKSRAVILNDKLNELGAQKFIANVDRIKEQQLRIKYNSLKQQLTSQEKGTASYNQTLQKLLAAQQDLESFIRGLERKYPVYYQYKYESSVYPYKAIKNTLKQQKQSSVEFFTGNSTIYALMLSPKKDKLIKIPFKEYSTIVKEFMTLCSNRSLLNQNYAHYSSLAYQLYNRLFKPLNVPYGRVILSPDDLFIPFEALLSKANVSTSFLIRNYTFSYTYSMRLLMKNRNTVSSPGNSFLGIAPITYLPYLHQPSLEGADQSLINIKSYFPSADFLISEKATKQQFVKNLSQFSIVQIYSHAEADSGNQQPLLYFIDSALNINEIQTFENVKTDIIVLSACKTAIGKTAKGEGVFSLARAFMGAGIPSTITTLWQVDNKATYQLTENFYKYLSQGLNKDEALRKAKLEFLESNDKTYQLPYYWASNIIFGKTDGINKKNTNRILPLSIMIIIPVIIMMVLILFMAIRKSALKKMG